MKKKEEEEEHKNKVQQLGQEVDTLNASVEDWEAEVHTSRT